jgi:glucosamine 6-phosphate synthetase-like amidotransferase/phosphosugar isomerase protein
LCPWPRAKLAAIPETALLQLPAHHVAKMKGSDADLPRDFARSMTME